MRIYKRGTPHVNSSIILIFAKVQCSNTGNGFRRVAKVKFPLNRATFNVSSRYASRALPLINKFLSPNGEPSIRQPCVCRDADYYYLDTDVRNKISPVKPELIYGIRGSS